MVNVGSVQSHRAQAVDMGWTYATSKGAVTAMSRRMALDLSSHGIRVNSISPGYTWTAMVMLHMLLVWMLNCVSLSTLYILLLLLLLLARSLTHALTHSRTHAITYSLTHSCTHALSYSRTHALTHSRTRALTHSLTPSLALAPSLVRSFVCSFLVRSFVHLSVHSLGLSVKVNR